jgi:uncharacterized protein YfiM (DUF2279 family)
MAAVRGRAAGSAGESAKKCSGGLAVEVAIADGQRCWTGRNAAAAVVAPSMARKLLLLVSIRMTGYMTRNPSGRSLREECFSVRMTGK